MILEIVVATDLKGGIGKDNQLLWHLPADLKYFKETTTGHPIIMGRKTFESIGRPLPNRVNVVLSSKPIDIPGILSFTSLEAAINELQGKYEKAFIIGGGQIYKSSFALPQLKRIHRTLVDTELDADTFFFIPENGFKKTQETAVAKDEKNKFDFKIEIWDRD